MGARPQAARGPREGVLEQVRYLSTRFLMRSFVSSILSAELFVERDRYRSPESRGVERAELPNIKSAKKRVRLSSQANARNRAVRSRLRTAVKRVENAENAETAEVEFRSVQVLLDRAATKCLIHPNAVARMKSNLSRRVGAMK